MKNPRALRTQELVATLSGAFLAAALAGCSAGSAASQGDAADAPAAGRAAAVAAPADGTAGAASSTGGQSASADADAAPAPLPRASSGDALSPPAATTGSTGAASGTGAGSKSDSTAPAPADGAPRSRTLIQKWVSEQVATVTSQPLNASQMNAWVNYFVTQSVRTESDLRAEMTQIATRDAVTYGWPPAPASSQAAADQSAADASSAAARSDASSDAAPATLNTLNTVVDDMRLLVDAPLKNVNPSYGFSRGPGYVIQGNQPNGAHAPDWFLATYPWLRGDTTPWNYMIPWLVVFEGTANTGSNVRMHFRNLKTWVKTRSTAQWKLVVKADSLSGESCDQNSNFYQCSTTPPELRAEADGGVSTPYVSGKNFHGYWGGITYVQGDDIAAVLVTLQARLIANDPSGPDQTGSAQFLMHTGADYYRDANGSSLIYPAVGIGRAKLLGPQWKAFNMMTFSDVGIQEPGGGISEAEFRASPPPLD